MATAPSRTADDITQSVRSLVDKVIEADVTERAARASRDVAAVLADATSTAADRAGDAWKESGPSRREAAKAFRRAGKDTARWWNRTWRKEIQPGARELWKRRSVALGAAGVAIPASREIIDDAAVRLGLKQREERHWGSFFLGLIVGAAVGALVAMLTTPKPGTEMREELASKAREASDWVPIFQREEETGATAGFGSENAMTAEVASADAVPPEAGTAETPAEPVAEPIDPEAIAIAPAEELDERT
ncbi:MAG: YtxH domain-containing protein [Chloroflexota bacterium]